MSKRVATVLAAACLLGVACKEREKTPAAAAARAAAATVVNDATLAEVGDGRNWLAFGRNYSEQRYSPLDQVNVETVKRLGLDWYLDLPDENTENSTPLAVDGVIYFTGSYSRVHAVDAKTGKELWTYDPKSIEHAGDRLRVMWDISRGLAYWNGKVIIATIDGRLVGLDAKNGSKLWEVQTTDTEKPLYITGAPKVFRGKVIIGNGGTEISAARGYLTAYDADTGEFAWRFWVVPGNPADGFEDEAMEMAAKTWTGEWWKVGGGGNTWHGITYDPEFNQVLIGTGNGSPWNRKIRSPGGGDNLFLCSIVALDADTGKYKWHYQTVPGESWDYNSSMDIVLADLAIDGAPRKVLLHAPKNGFFYVIDRSNGKLLSAEKIGKATWASHIDMATGRPVEVPGARYEDGEEEVWPSPFGVHSWHAMSFNPKTGLVYIPTIEMAGVYKDTGIDLEALDVARHEDRSRRRVRRRRHAGGREQGRAARVGSGEPEEGLGDSASAELEPRHDDHRGRPRLRGPRRRPLPRLRRAHRQGALVGEPRGRDLGAADHLRDRREAVRLDPGGLGRRGSALGHARGAARLAVQGAAAPALHLRARRGEADAAVAAAGRGAADGRSRVRGRSRPGSSSARRPTRSRASSATAAARSRAEPLPICAPPRSRSRTTRSRRSSSLASASPRACRASRSSATPSSTA